MELFLRESIDDTDGGPWLEIFQIGIDGEDSKDYGTRMASISYNMERRKVFVVGALNGQWSTLASFDAPIEEWFPLNISQTMIEGEFIYIVRDINGIIYDNVNNDPIDLGKVYVRASNDKAAAPASLRSLHVVTTNSTQHHTLSIHPPMLSDRKLNDYSCLFITV